GPGRGGGDDPPYGLRGPRDGGAGIPLVRRRPDRGRVSAYPAPRRTRRAHMEHPPGGGDGVPEGVRGAAPALRDRLRGGARAAIRSDARAALLRRPDGGPQLSQRAASGARGAPPAAALLLV